MPKKSFSFISGPLAGFVAGILFLYLLFVFRMGFLLTLALTGAFFVGVFLILKVLLTPPALKIDLRDGLTSEDVQDVLGKGQSLVEKLSGLGKRLESLPLRSEVAKITEVCQRIFEILEKDPVKIKAARQFLGHYLESTVTIVEKYLEIEASGVESAAAEETQKRTLEILPQIETAFEKQLARLMESDLMNLDVEIKTLETIFRSENLSK